MLKREGVPVESIHVSRHWHTNSRSKKASDDDGGSNTIALRSIFSENLERRCESSARLAGGVRGRRRCAKEGR